MKKGGKMAPLEWTPIYSDEDRRLFSVVTTHSALILSADFSSSSFFFSFFFL